MDKYSFQFPYRVSIGDINYGGHVSNAAVLTIFQDARLAFLDNLGSFSEVNVGGCGLIMPEAHIYYRREMFHNDRLEIGVRALALKRSGFTLEYRMERDGELMVEGNTQLVCFDYQKRKPCRMPTEFLAALKRVAVTG